MKEQKEQTGSANRLKPLAHGAANRCFGCGEANRTGLRLRFLVDDEGTVICRVKIPARFEGPRGHVHGGVIATLLDEVMSKANRVRGVVAMTRRLEVDYLRPVPLRTPIEIIGRHLRADGRKHFCEAEIRLGKTAIATGNALFIAIPVRTPDETSSVGL
ncbi:PaaI family thioesterase [Silvibacterium sp.]|uniref:PaaI family thioesterase n=1 Tax=Silvibacterium sp. TaxID=1964179 RepID=UPI0039E47DD5